MLDLAIIGGGPAGLTAGLYAARGGVKNVVLFEPAMPGGQITQSSEIENYPGKLEVISGMEFMQSWLPQAQKFGLKHESDEIARVAKSDQGIFILTTSGGKTIEAKAVIFATGSVPKKIGFEGEDEFFGRGVSVCATCDGFFYRGKEVAIIGGGDAALEEAIYLAKTCKKVYIIHRREGFRAAPSTVERAKAEQNIEFVLNAKPIKILGDSQNGVTGVKVAIDSKGEIDINVPGVFVFVGRSVKNEPLKDQKGGFICATNDKGEVIVDLKMRTNLEGFFVAGDVRADSPKQVVCAASDGAISALSAIEYLERKRG
ncbi:MAG: thioredoxin-disulfide reductase [Helicobacteraceae bacterium]|jgi:thioredoxin reductase (NADPH)|nr:thioredoxin-disulfide reductase [Helicobacteraceae bacterium]